jgi:hypothetical protein
MRLPQTPQIASQSFNFHFVVPTQDREDIRWYLEDYLLNAFDPAPAIAARIEQRINQIGVQLFEHLFRANKGTEEVWSEIRGNLPSTRIEIATDVDTSAHIPWRCARKATRRAITPTAGFKSVMTSLRRGGGSAVNLCTGEDFECIASFTLLSF